ATANINAASARQSVTPDRIRLLAAEACSFIPCLFPPHARVSSLERPYRKNCRLFALRRAEGLEQPHIEILHLARAGPHEFPHSRQHLFERFKLQSELCQLRRATVGVEPKGEGVRICLGACDPLFTEGQSSLDHSRSFAFRVVDF